MTLLLLTKYSTLYVQMSVFNLKKKKKKNHTHVVFHRDEIIYNISGAANYLRVKKN